MVYFDQICNKQLHDNTSSFRLIFLFGVQQPYSFVTFQFCICCGSPVILSTYSINTSGNVNSVNAQVSFCPNVLRCDEGKKYHINTH